MELFGLYFGIIDWVIVGLAILFLIIGIAKGFVKQLLSFAKGLVSLVVAFFLTNTVADLLSKTSLFDFFDGKINPYIVEKFPETASVSVSAVSTQEEFQTVLADAGINKLLTRLVSGAFNVENFDGAEYLNDAISASFTMIVLKVISFIALFILTIIVLAILLKILENIVDSSAVAKFFDKILGLGFGALKGVVLISVLALIAGLVAKFIAPVNEFFTEQLFLNDDSIMTVGKYIFTTNPLTMFFKHIFG